MYPQLFCGLLVIILSLSTNLYAAPPAASSPSAEVIAVTMVGDNSYPPYSFVEHGEFKGIYPDLIRAIVESMPEYQVSLVPLPWKRALLNVKSGDAAFIFPPYLRPQERPHLIYSAPMLAEHQVLFCHRTLALDQPRIFPDSFKGLRLGKNLGFSVGNNITQSAKKGLFHLVTVTDATTALRRIQGHKLDCYINDRLSVLYEADKYAANSQFDKRDLVEAYHFSQEHGYLAGSREAHLYPYVEDFIQSFNRILKTKQRNGELDRILNRYVDTKGAGAL